jgi:hypothetical protein
MSSQSLNDIDESIVEVDLDHPRSQVNSSLSCWKRIQIYSHQLCNHPTTQIALIIAVLTFILGYPLGNIILLIQLIPEINDMKAVYVVMLSFGPILMAPIVALIGVLMYYGMRHCLQCCQDIRLAAQEDIQLATMTSMEPLTRSDP